MSALPVEIWFDILHIAVTANEVIDSSFIPEPSDLKPIRGLRETSDIFRRLYDDFEALQHCVHVSPRCVNFDRQLGTISKVRLPRIRHLCFIDDERIHGPVLSTDAKAGILSAISCCTNLQSLGLRVPGFVVGNKQLLNTSLLSSLTRLELPLDCITNPEEPLLDLPSVTSLQLFVRLAGTSSSEPVFLSQIRFPSYIGEYDGGEELVSIVAERLVKLPKLAELSMRLSLEEPFESQMQLDYHHIEHWEKMVRIADCDVCATRFQTNRRFVVFQENVASRALGETIETLECVSWGDPWVENWSKADRCQRTTHITRTGNGEIALKREDGLTDSIWE